VRDALSDNFSGISPHDIDFWLFSVPTPNGLSLKEHLVDQSEIHKKAHSKSVEDRQSAVRQFKETFLQLPDKSQAWCDLQKLTHDEYFFVRKPALIALIYIFGQISLGDLIGEDLHKLTHDEYSDVRKAAADALRSTFSEIPNKNQAWKNLISLTKDEYLLVRDAAAEAIVSAFGYVPDQNLAWEDLHELVQDNYFFVRKAAIKTLGSSFSQIPNKDQAWLDLHGLYDHESFFIREIVAEAIVSAFSRIPDKDLAWKDLFELIKDKHQIVRIAAIKSLRDTFAQIPNKDQTWQDLISLTQSEKKDIRSAVAYVLSFALDQISDKDQAWRDLYNSLKPETDIEVRKAAANALGSSFSQFINKDAAWQDLIRLAQEGDNSAKSAAATYLVSAFCHVENRDRAWQDLHKLITGNDIKVLRAIAYGLGSSYNQVSNKEQAIQDLKRLTKQDDIFVKAYANNSLGRISILEASEANDQNILKIKLEEATKYFCSASEAFSVANNPAKFCYPFYKCYLAIIFENASEKDVEKYLEAAEKAIEGSEIKEDLLNALKYLFKALQESQKLKKKSLEDIANELKVYRWYCEKVSEHMTAAEESAPGTVKFMKKFHAIIEEKMQADINTIQEKAMQICQNTRGSGTEYEKHAAEIQKASQILSTGDLYNMQKSITRIAEQLKKFCKLLPTEERGQVCKVVEDIAHTAEFPEKLHNIVLALSSISTHLKDQKTPLVDIVILTALFDHEYGAICTKLSIFAQPEIQLNSNLYSWKFWDVPSLKHKDAYRVALGVTGRAGNNQSALAANEAIDMWRPRYIIFSGIAGGLSNSKLGDVIIADVIYGYEYGKIDGKFNPRGNWTYKTDLGLLTGAGTYALHDDWRDGISVKPLIESTPRVISGEIASGEKVVDDPTNEFFKQVLKMWPKVKAVEMEGFGVGIAIEHAQSLGIPVGFMIIRGISDLPRPNKDNEARVTNERDAWKAYAGDTAAAFTVGWIKDGLPVRPSTRSSDS
jgi:HEAT repeat protein/nucleoside phosphorylase